MRCSEIGGTPLHVFRLLPLRYHLGMRNEAAEPNKYREALRRKGWTLARGAAEAGYSPSYFAMMLREPRLMSEQMNRRLAEVLDLEPSDKKASES